MQYNKNVISRDEFVTDFLAMLEWCDSKDLTIVMSDARSISNIKRKAVRARGLDAKTMEALLVQYNETGMFYAFADSTLFSEYIKDLMRRAHEQVDMSDEELDVAYADIEKMTVDEVLKEYNAQQRLRIRSVSQQHVKYRPQLYIDIDLKDHYEVVKEDKATVRLIPSKYLETEEAFKKWVVSAATPVEIKKTLNIIIDIDSVVAETSPNYIVYTGHGLHIVYTMPKGAAYPKTTIHYKSTYVQFADAVISIAGEGILYDTSCKNVSRNMRMPLLMNSSKDPSNPKLSEIIYYSDLTTISTFLTDSMARGTEARSGGKTSSAAASSSVEEIFGVTAETKRTVEYSGMPDIDNNSKLRWYISDHIHLEEILRLFSIDEREYTQQDGVDVKTTKSPLRDGDINPSFWFNDKTMVCSDWGGDLSGEPIDYGTLVMRLYDRAKAERGRHDLIPTTVYEAEFILLLLSFADDMRKDENGDSKEDYTNVFMASTYNKKAKKSVPPSAYAVKYYSGLRSKLVQISARAYREMRTGDNGSNARDTVLDILIDTIPRVYYFPFFSRGTFGNDEYKSNIMAKRILESLILEGRFVYQRSISGPNIGEIELYMYNAGVHVPVRDYYGVSQEFGVVQKETVETLVGVKARALGFADADFKANKARLIEAVLALSTIEKKLDEMTHTSISDLSRVVELSLLAVFSLPSHDSLSLSIRSYLRQGSGKKYIRFKNTYVCYDSDSPYEIGEKVPLSEDFFTQVARGKERQDIVTYDRSNYEYKKGDTPRFDDFVNFLSDSTNGFKKKFASFISNLLYPPHGNTRALFLVGDGSNGKSVLSGILSQLLGSKAVSSESIDIMTKVTSDGAQSRSAIVNKILNITPDATGIVLGGAFKTMITGEPTQIKVLYRQPQTVFSFAKHLINSNRVPQLTGEATAFKRRVLFCPLSRVVRSSEAVMNLESLIVTGEGDQLWYKLIQLSRVNQISLRVHGKDRFLTQHDIDLNDNLLLLTNDLYEFVDQCIKFDKEEYDRDQNDTTKTFVPHRLTLNSFLQAYNQHFVGMMDIKRWANSSDNGDEINQFIRLKIQGKGLEDYFTQTALQKVLKYRKSITGLPYVYVHIENHMSVTGREYDSRDNTRA